MKYLGTTVGGFEYTTDLASMNSCIQSRIQSDDPPLQIE